MALHQHKGRIYCDASDLEAFLARNTLYCHLSRARRRGGAYQNIANPFYNNRNSKRWVLLESIPPELRQQIEQNIKKAGIFQEVAIAELEEEGAPAEEIGLTSTQITSEAVRSTQPALRAALEKYLDTHYEGYLEYYFMQAQPHAAAYRLGSIFFSCPFLYLNNSLLCRAYCMR